MQKVNDLSELVNGKNYVDIYVSTDVNELIGNKDERDGILGQIGFIPMGCIEDQGKYSLYSDFDGFANDFESLLHKKTNLRIDCAETIYFDQKSTKEKFGFMPMSKFRVYINGSNNMTNEIVAFLKILDSERQNVAIVNGSETKGFIKLSEFYKSEKFESLQAWLESRTLPSDLY